MTYTNPPRNLKVKSIAFVCEKLLINTKIASKRKPNIISFLRPKASYKKPQTKALEIIPRQKNK